MDPTPAEIRRICQRIREKGFTNPRGESYKPCGPSKLGEPPPVEIQVVEVTWFNDEGYRE